MQSWSIQHIRASGRVLKKQILIEARPHGIFNRQGSDLLDGYRETAEEQARQKAQNARLDHLPKTEIGSLKEGVDGLCSEAQSLKRSPKSYGTRAYDLTSSPHCREIASGFEVMQTDAPSKRVT